MHLQDAIAHRRLAARRFPGPYQGDFTDPLAVSTSLPIVVAPAQMGWGYVNGSIAHEIAQRALGVATPPTADKTMARMYQADFQAMREAYWSSIR